MRVHVMPFLSKWTPANTFLRPAVLRWTHCSPIMRFCGILQSVCITLITGCTMFSLLIQHLKLSFLLCVFYYNVETPLKFIFHIKLQVTFHYLSVKYFHRCALHRMFLCSWDPDWHLTLTVEHPPHLLRSPHLSLSPSQATASFNYQLLNLSVKQSWQAKQEDFALLIVLFLKYRLVDLNQQDYCFSPHIACCLDSMTIFSWCLVALCLVSPLISMHIDFLHLCSVHWIFLCEWQNHKVHLWVLGIDPWGRAWVEWSICIAVLSFYTRKPVMHMCIQSAS